MPHTSKDMKQSKSSHIPGGMQNGTTPLSISYNSKQSFIVQSLQLTKINFLNYFHTDFIHNIKYVNNSKVHQHVKGQTKSSQCAQRSITQQ